MISKPHIFSFGEVLWDLFPEGAQFGGAAANFACHAALLGAEVHLVSAVGEDEQGREAVEILQQIGVNTSLLQQVATAPTGTVSVSVGAEGKPIFVIHADSAWDAVAWTAELAAAIAAADAVYFGTLGQRSLIARSTIRKALGFAKSRGILRVLDINLRAPFDDAAMIRESISLANVLKLSDEELPAVTAACGVILHSEAVETLQALREHAQLELVAMTRGEDGALLVTEDKIIDQPGTPTVVRDTVGAGDSFTAALVVGRLRGEVLADIARVACQLASSVCAHQGAVPPRSKSPSR